MQTQSVEVGTVATRQDMMSQKDETDEKDRIVEEGPEYRSVSIQPEATPGMGPIFVPLKNAKKSTTALHHSKTRRKEQQMVSYPSFYRWQVQNLQELPIDYNLVKTNVYVEDSSAQKVAQRICNALKTLSITVDPNSSKENSSIYAETQHGIKLAISLFGHCDMIVVEVRRQSGCSILFRDVAKNVLRHSKGLGDQQQQQQKQGLLTRKLSIPSMLTRRPWNVQCECIRDSFRIACTMLHSSKADTHILAIESIGKMIVCSEAKVVAAKLLLSSHDCLKQILFLLDFYTTHRSSSGMESSYHSILCRKILEALADACEVLNENDLAVILSRNDHDLKTNSFVNLLLSFLREASTRPHEAVHAARCMRYLLISKEVVRLLDEMSVMDVITDSRCVGVNVHEALEEESNKLMGQLQNLS